MREDVWKESPEFPTPVGEDSHPLDAEADKSEINRAVWLFVLLSEAMLVVIALTQAAGMSNLEHSIGIAMLTLPFAQWIYLLPLTIWAWRQGKADVARFYFSGGCLLVLVVMTIYVTILICFPIDS